MKRVSVVVPTYNEPALGVWLDRLERVLAPFEGELVIVDDSTPPLELPPGRAIVLRGEQRGKGDAVRIGTLAATGEVVFHVDADVDEEKLALIPEFVRLAETHDVVMAERRSRWQYRNLGRFILSIGLFLAQRFFIFQSTRFFDTQCGFKAYRRDAARRLATLQSVRGGMYDIEYLYIATKNGLSIAQVPVAPMRELRPSRLRVWRCLVTDPVDLLRVKWNGLRGRYTR
ncbi:MAG TPA: glycosyltransferase [Thermoanaerobaculia bacterium]|nr:glycosyltransferase [Thermoanaerobaculia bacterium]